MISSMRLPMAGFTSALAAASYSSDALDSINNPPPTDAKDRAVQEEEELDALQQLSDFLTHPGYDPDNQQWRYRVLIRDLIDEAPVFVADQDSSFDETASAFSDETSNTSIRVFLGAQAKTVPAGWRATSTPKHASAFSNMTAINSPPSIEIASPQCSPLSLVAETSQDSLPSKTYLLEVEEKDAKNADLDAFVRASSPTSEPSPTPKITDSKSTDLSTSSPDVSGSSSIMVSSFPNHPKHVASFLLLSSAPPHQQPTRREEKPHVLPMCPRPLPTPSNVKVLKLTNLPWSVNSEDLLQWLGNDVKKALIPVESQVVSVHILCDRSKCRTKCPAYVEITSCDVAHDIIKRLNKQQYEGRNIRITLAPRKELQAAIFPTWAQNGLSTTSKGLIITSAELEGLVELCKLKTPFAKSTPERPYMNLLSIAAKYPWQSVDLLNVESEEQSKVLQAVRDGHKLLNQHGKRLKDYAALKYLFTSFLEKHGGVSGSLRPIPVSSHLVPALPSTGPNLPVSRRPRISQTLLDLINPNKENNITSGVTPKVHSTIVAGITPDFVPAVAKERFKVLQAAPIKKESIYKLPSHLPPTPTSQIFPTTPPKSDHVIHLSEKSANTTCPKLDVYLQNQSTSSVDTSKTEDIPTYAKVASNFDLSPEVIEKIAKVEKLFTPIRMKFSKEDTPAQEKVCIPCDGRKPEKLPVPEDVPSYNTTRVLQGGSTEFTLLNQMADELGVTVETIKAIVKRLGAML